MSNNFEDRSEYDKGGPLCPRSPAMQKFVDEAANSMFGRTNAACIAARQCVTCGNSADSFRDPLSIQEYNISGMCQKCQDMTFGS